MSRTFFSKYQCIDIDILKILRNIIDESANKCCLRGKEKQTTKSPKTEGRNREINLQ